MSSRDGEIRGARDRGENKLEDYRDCHGSGQPAWVVGRVWAVATITSPPPISSKDRRFTEWSTDSPPTTHPRYLPFTEPSSATLHPFVLGTLGAKSCRLQTACFQLITGHSFQADYSTRFRPSANDTLSCPHCGERYTTRHILLECTHLDDLRLETIGNYSLFRLFSTASGAARLTVFLHKSQELLRPLPPSGPALRQAK